MTETTEETSSEQADAGDPPSTTSGPALSVVILAAGQGTRMRSRTHKVLHELAGKPMIHRVLDLAASVGGSQPVVVLGHLPEQVRSALPPTVRTVIQEPQLGTGHAVQTAAEPLRADGAERLLALLGDIAVYQQETLQALVDQPIGPDAPIALLNARVPDPHGYGRVLRRPDGAISGMVEEIEATAEQRQVDEIWSGVMLL